MTKDKIFAKAQSDANRENKPMAVLNLNVSGAALYVVRFWDDRYQGARDLVGRVNPIVETGETIGEQVLRGLV